MRAFFVYITGATHELWVQENIYKLPEQIFKAVLGVLRVQHPPWSTQQTMDALAAPVPTQRARRDSTERVS